MKKKIPRILILVGVFLAAGVFGAAWELLLDRYFHLTEPLIGGYWFWSFFHRAKFYAVLGAASGGLMTLVAWGYSALVRLIRKKGGLKSPGRAAYAGAFAAPLAATPLWYVLANVKVELPETAGAGIIAGWFGALTLLTFVIYALGARFPAVGRHVRRVLGGLGYAPLFIYLAGGIIATASRPAPRPGLPDVVIITLDACRVDQFGPRPDGTTLTPNIDRFAENAVVFTHCRSQASWTSPSLSTLHTGQYPMVHYATAHRPLGTSQPTLAELMGEAGYDTRAVVANRLCHRSLGMARGFDDYLYWDQNRFIRALGYYETYFYYLENRIYEKRNTRVGEKDDHTTIITDRLVDIFEEDRGRPLFLWTHYLDPHTPYSPPPEYVAAEDRPFIDKFGHGNRKKADLNRRLYDGEVRYVDDELGRVLPLIPPDALVIISSDHGEEFWEHDGFDHGKTLYEEVIRVPLVVRFPEGRGGVSDAPVAVIDLAPTILGHLGLDVPPSMQGRDISAAASAAEWDFPVFAGSSMLAGERQYTVVYRGRKLILGHKESMSAAKYFDLAADPGELDPLIVEDDARLELERSLDVWLTGNIAFAEKFERPEVSGAIHDQMRAIGYIQ
jgi:arylsulfatase A-like enzyme